MKIQTMMTIPIHRMFRPLLIPFTMVAMTATALGAEKSAGTWADVQKIRVGRAVEVVQSDSAHLRGRLVSTTEDGLILRVDGTERSFARSTLLSVAVQERKTAKGAGIGLMVGTAMAYPSGKLQGVGAACGGVAFDTGVGVAIGALYKGYRTVYRVPQAGPPTR